MAFRIRKDIGRRVKRVRAQKEQDAEELAYWLSRPSHERVDAAAFMTRRLYRMEHGTGIPCLDKSAGRRVARSRG